MNEIENIKNRLFSIIPMSSLHMMEFLKLMNIRFTDEVPSAAVTCTSRPELLLNKDFIDQYCQSDEHLFMLIMHELYHIILGHTHLFKRHTEIDNIAFDAVINAILCRMFPGEEYVSFFTNLNPDSSFPGCILRPIGKNTPSKYIPILKNLYFTNTGTYFEVYECIAKELKEKGGAYVLIGNHDERNEEESNPLLKRMLDDIISKWPRELMVDGRDLGGELKDGSIKFIKNDERNKNKMRRLLRKSGIISGVIDKRKANVTYIKEDAISVIPDYKDRTLLSKSIIYQQPLLYNSSLNTLKINKDNHVKTLIYLDVSGSVVDDINRFASLLLKPYKNKECLLFAFSTEVVPVTYKEFKEGKYQSTYGTDINCIFDHYFLLNKKYQTKKILILTDGMTGRPSNENYQKIISHKLDIYVGYFGRYDKEDLKDISKYDEEFN